MLNETRKKRFVGFESRVRQLQLGVLAGLCVLIIRLWHLQIVEGDQLAAAADQNRLHPVRLSAPRGMIFARDLTANATVPLADNRGAWDLVFVPGDNDASIVCDQLEKIIDIDRDDILKQVDENKDKPFKQIVIKQDLSKTELTRIEEYSHVLPGIITVVRPKRRYAQGKTAGQMIGYMGEIDENELKRNEGVYTIGDQIGKAGLETQYENVLRGQDGRMLVKVYATDRRPQLRTNLEGKADIVVDSYGRQLETEFRIEPKNGGRLDLTLDVPLQQFCEKTLGEKVGAIVVLNADTGEVLAMASSPGYDPSVFTTHGKNRERASLLKDKTKPMRNRAYREVYPPGSVFKLMMAVGALEDGIIDENTTHFCPGSFQLPGSRRWQCHQRGGHGSVNVVDALSVSCDVFFYHVGLDMGVDRIKKWADLMSLGQLTGIDLPNEAVGLVPSPEWKKKVNPDDPSEQRWYPGETVNLSIGQGAMALTPLQLAVMTACIINGGHRVRPYVNLALGPQLSEPFISPHTLEVIQAGMFKCVDDTVAPSGTGRATKMEGFKILGKTGTAQVASMSHYSHLKDEMQIPYALRAHAWFVCGVLDRTPRISICVLYEHGLHGSSGATPLAREVIKFFYRDQETPVPQLLAQSEGAE